MSRDNLLQIVDSMRDEMVECLKSLIAIPSDNPPGIYEEISKYLDDKYKELGLESEIVKVPDEEVKAHGLTTPRYNVLARLGKPGGKRLILNPHIDAVPPASGWSTDPYVATIKEGRVYGRGACDSKNQCTVYGYALSAIKKAGIELAGEAVIVATADEETGGELGAGYMLREGYSKGDWAISEGNCYSIINAMGGCLHLKATVKGKASHAAMPDQGIDALERMNAILTRLYAYRDTLKETTSQITGIKHPTMVVGTIQGGVKTNVVPSECVITIDRRIIPEEDSSLVEAKIRSVIESARESFPDLEVKVERVMLADAYGPAPADSEVIKALERNGEKVLGEAPNVTGSNGFADSRFYWNMERIPSVMYGAGPRGWVGCNAHGPDENVEIEDMVKAAKVIALTVVDLLSGTE